ncbi:hypothetical protein ACJX0J_004320 [Zea mays]
MEALVYTKAYKLQWIYEKIYTKNFLPSNFRFLFEEPLPFANRSNTVADGVLNPFFLISVENFKYGELHLLSKLLQVGIITWNLHTFVVTCHLDTSLQLRSIFIQIVEADYGSYGNAFIFFASILILILGTIAGTSFPYFKYSVFFSLGIFRLLPSESSLDT